jgi:hypothetical protein
MFFSVNHFHSIFTFAVSSVEFYLSFEVETKNKRNNTDRENPLEIKRGDKEKE